MSFVATVQYRILLIHTCIQTVKSQISAIWLGVVVASPGVALSASF